MTDVLTHTETQPPAPGGNGTSTSKRHSVLRRERRAGLLFVVPFFATFLLFFFLPLAYAFYLSLYREQLVGGTVFAGFGNYSKAIQDSVLWGGVRRTLLYGVIQVPTMLILALLIALALDSGKLRFSKVFRIGVFLPYAVPTVIAALMWGYLYGPDFGPFAQIAENLGTSAPKFLSTTWILPSLANVATWSWCGYNAIILYAALRGVSPELYEAAAIDGCGPIRTAWHIKIPAIASALMLTLVFSIIGTLQLFVEPQIFQTLAPTVIGPGFTPNLYAYTSAFTNQAYGYSAAISFVLGAFIVVFSYAVITVSARRARARA
jgi:multiple sugar transport system permease protein